MYRVAREIEFCYGHRLINYDGKCRHLHGHNGKAVILLEGEALDRRGMLVDFGDIKQHVLGERVFVMDANPTAENIAALIYRQARDAGLPVVRVTLWETPKCHAIFGD